MVTEPLPTLLLTRPLTASRRFVQELDGLGVDLPTVISPILKIRTMPADRSIAAYPDLIVTSENALAALSAGECSDHRIWAVGPRTAAAARAAGCPEVIVAEGTAEALVRRILADPPSGPMLHLRGSHARGDIVSRLTEGGIVADATVVYDQVAQPLSSAARACLDRRGMILLPLFSPRSAALVAALVGDPAARLTVIAISPATAGGWNRNPMPYVVDRPDGRAMAQAVAAAAAGKLVGRKATR